MLMIYHGDQDDNLFDEPRFFGNVSEAVAYATERMKKHLPKGHALTLYDCSERRVWEAEN